MINQITKMRLPDGTEVAFVDWTDQPLWSTAMLLNGFTDDEVQLFTYAPGDPITVTSNVTTGFQATERDTNVTLAGAFADTEEMLIYAIKPEISSYTAPSTGVVTGLLTGPGQPMPSATNLKLLSDQLNLRLWISQKVLMEAGLGYFNAGFGPNGAHTFDLAGGAAVAQSNQGLPSQEAVRSLAMPVYIGGTEKYRVTLSNFTGGAVGFGRAIDGTTISANAVIRCRIYLDGLYKRPVS